MFTLMKYCFPILVCFFLSVTKISAQTIDVIYMPKGVLATLVDGRVEGAFPDVFREAARRIDRKVTLKPIAWKRAQVIAKKETGAALAPLTRVQPREGHYVWIEPLLPLQLTFMALKKRPINPVSINDLAGLRVAVQSGSVADVITSKMVLDNVELYQGTSDEAILKMLKRERIDGWLIWDIVGAEAVKRLALADSVKSTFSYTVGPLYLATNKTVSISEIELWRNALKEMHADGFIQKTLNQHYGINIRE